ncbi:MAG: transporter substrate-binding domain-containing protein [Gammaproteobacteria bacterium]|nr:transporter substrate-binding domain-containing protein [Gammaproteobacteria bacterium]
MTLSQKSLRSICLTLIFLSPVLAEENIKTITSAPKAVVVIASSNNFPPINLLNDQGELTGFASEIADAVMLEMGITATHIHSSSWPTVLSWLDSGKADLIHDTGYTIERTKTMDFSQPIIEMPESIFVRDQQYNIHSISDLSGLKVACVNRHITHIYLKKFKEIDCYLVNTPAEGLIALINGHADAFIYPEQIILFLAQKLHLERNIKVTGDPLRKLSWSMTVKKGNITLLKQLNTGIEKIKKNGKYQLIYDKWFGKRVLSGFTKNEVFLITGIAVLTALLIAISLGLWGYTRSMRKANLALEKNEHKYRTLIENLPESIFLKDTNSVYISCNQRFADEIGLDSHEISGKSDNELFPHNARLYQQGDQEVINKGETLTFIETYQNENSEKGYINTVKTPVYDENKQLIGVLGFFWDITEQHTLQKHLANVVKQYETVTSTVPDVMYRLNTDGNIVWWNETFSRVTGKQPDQIGNLHALDVIAKDDHEAISLAIKNTLESGQAEVEAGLITTDGIVPYYFNGARIQDAQGNLLGLAGSGRDMRKQKQHEQRQKDLLNQLQQAQKMESIGQLTGGIAHDFNNMLNSVLGFTDLASERVKLKFNDEELLSYLNTISTSGENARVLIQKLLAYSRINKSDAAVIDIDNFVKELVSMLRPMIPTSISLETNIESDLPAILIDAVMMQQCLVNLCINAKDAMNQQGHLIINVKRLPVNNQLCDACHHKFSGDYIEFSIEDTGTGIPEQDFSRIFEPFMTTKDVNKGTGMGLAMVHGITHDHDGHIQVKTEPGQTIFSLFIPITSAPAATDTPGIQQAENKSKIHTGNRRILIIDDEKNILNLLEAVFTSKDYEVALFDNSQLALAAFKASPNNFDAVITDQTMPNLTGKEVSQEILSIRPELPIILCTGFSEHIDEKSAKEIGIRAFLRKPVKNSTLLKTIEDLIC